MDGTLTPAQARRAAAWAAAATAISTLAAGTAFAVAHATTWDGSSEEAVTLVLSVVAGAALLRLAWVCAQACFDLAQLSTTERESARRGPSRRPRERALRGGRHRAATLFLAMAAVTAVAGPAAQAAPASVVTALADESVAERTQAPPSLRTPALPESVAGSSTTPAPNFSGPDLVVDSERVADPRGTSGAPTSEAPAPGWTPNTAPASPDLAPLVVGPTAPPTELDEHVVVRGDTLWGIAADRLAPDATPEDILHSMEAWLHANPWLAAHADLLRVGDVLAAPSASTTSPSPQNSSTGSPR